MAKYLMNGEAWKLSSSNFWGYGRFRPSRSAVADTFVLSRNRESRLVRTVFFFSFPKRNNGHEKTPGDQGTRNDSTRVVL
jgi:hypothetical protein